MFTNPTHNLEEISKERDIIYQRMLFYSWGVLFFYTGLYFWLEIWAVFFSMAASAFILLPISLFLHRIQRKYESKILYLSTCCISVCLSGMCFQHKTGEEYFYFCGILLLFIVFEVDKERKTIVSFLITFLTLGFASGLELYTLIPENLLVDQSTLPIELIKRVNYGGAFGTCMLFMAVFIKTIGQLSRALISQHQEESNALKEAQKVAKMGSWSYHLPTKEEIWSEQMFEIFSSVEKSDEEKIRIISKTINEEDRKDWKERVNDYANCGDPIAFDFRYRGKNGEEKWIRAHGEGLKDENGFLETLIGTCQDVTAEKNRERDPSSKRKNPGSRKRYWLFVKCFWKRGLYF